MTTLTIDQARQDLGNAAQKALLGEEVVITVGVDSLGLVRDIPLRPPGYFAGCYQEETDAAFEARICRDSKPVLDA